MNTNRDLYNEGKQQFLRWYQSDFADKCKGMHDGTTEERITKAKTVRQWLENKKISQPSAHDLADMGFNSGANVLIFPLNILIHTLYKLQEIEK